jgi:hypothetical protein
MTQRVPRQLSVVVVFPALFKGVVLLAGSNTAIQRSAIETAMQAGWSAQVRPKLLATMARRLGHR